MTVLGSESIQERVWVCVRVKEMHIFVCRNVCVVMSIQCVIRVVCTIREPNTEKRLFFALFPNNSCLW